MYITWLGIYIYYTGEIIRLRGIDAYVGMWDYYPIRYYYIIKPQKPFFTVFGYKRLTVSAVTFFIYLFFFLFNSKRLSTYLNKCRYKQKCSVPKLLSSRPFYDPSSENVIHSRHNNSFALYLITVRICYN